MIDLDHIFIDQKSLHSSVALRAQTLFPADKITIVDDEPYQAEQGELSKKQFDRSKRQVFITPHAGQFFKRCPGARPGLTCCNYFVLNLGLQCNMNCSYCYLQDFINTPVMKIYSNINQALSELDEIGATAATQSLRIGTGEVIDSLSLDELTLYSRELIQFFRSYPHWRLEFKTKSACVDQFLDIEHSGNVIVSWSINPQFIIGSEEHSTASLADRLQAAKKCRDRGFQVSFHIDPMIWHPDWQDNYAELVDQVTASFKPNEIPYISVGSLRFQPRQRHMMRERFGMNSWVTKAEVFSSPDGKLRYDQKLRQQMFDFVMTRFREKSNQWKIFLCMESPEVWLGANHQLPYQIPALRTLFDHKVTHAAQSRI